jgi:hypothetical protein
MPGVSPEPSTGPTRRFGDFVERYAFLVPKNDREEI